MDDVRPAEAHADPRFGRLLVIIVAMFVLSAFDARWTSVTIGLLTAALVVVALRATSLRTTAPRLTAMTMVAVAAVVVTAVADRNSAANAMSSFAQAILVFVLFMLVVAVVVRSEEVDVGTIVGAVTAYAMIGMAFSAVYFGLDIIDEDQISIPSSDRSQYPEFSFVVLTTLGFGDQTPTAPLAARVVVIQAVAGQIFLTVFIARLVSLYRRRPASSSDGPHAQADGTDPS